MSPEEMFPLSLGRLRAMEAEAMELLKGEIDEASVPLDQVDIATLIPGGIEPADRWYRDAINASCSRCRCPISRYEEPLTLWFSRGEEMLIYCNRCTSGPVLVPAPDPPRDGAEAPQPALSIISRRK